MSSKRPTKGETYAGSFVPLVAAYTAAACCCEKQRVMLTLMPCLTDICTARSPSAVHGYLTYALGIHEYISFPWRNMSCANVFRSENTSIETPASPTNGEIVSTILLYSSISSRLESLCPDAMSSRMCGFLAIREGFVVCPSTKPSNCFTRTVSCGSPPSTNIFVLGRVIEKPPYCSLRRHGARSRRGQSNHQAAASWLCLKKANNSALISSFKVDTIPCGAPGMIFRIDPFTSFEDRRAEARIGTI